MLRQSDHTKDAIAEAQRVIEEVQENLGNQEPCKSFEELQECLNLWTVECGGREGLKTTEILFAKSNKEAGV